MTSRWARWLLIALVFCEWARGSSFAQPPVPSACVGAVRVTGESQIVESLRHALEARGMRVAGEGECVSTSVEVERVGERIRVAQIGAGATLMRELDRIETAALLVESWTAATDVDLLEPPPAIAEPAAAEVAPAAPAVVVEPAAVSPEVDRAIVATLLALAEASFGNDGSTWFGARLGACAHAGPTCLGGSLRYLSDSGLTEGTLGTGEGRVYLGADADLSLPIVVSPLITLEPTVALGLGWFRSSVVEGTQRVDADGLRARLEGSFAAAVHLIDWLALELAVAVTWSPLARGSAWVLDGQSIDPDPVVFGAVQLGLRLELR